MYLRSGQPVRPYYYDQVNEGSTVSIPYVGIIQNDLTIIDSLRYRVDNLTDSVVIKSWTDVADPGSTGTIVISASDNSVTRDWRDKQLNQVTLEFTYADGTVQQKAQYYELCAMFIGAS